MVLPWNRAQQAAFLIRAWADLKDSIASFTGEWATALRADTLEVEPDQAFAGPKTLPNTDQGVRAVLFVRE